MPPGVTPEHCAMKSDRHSALIALRCSSVGACADATPAENAATQSAGNPKTANQRRRLPCGAVSKEDAHCRIYSSPYKSMIYFMKSNALLNRIINARHSVGRCLPLRKY
jgi:hypothetical protein